MAHTIKVVRVYEWDDSLAGHKFLVDRLWPRGVSRDSLEPFNWAKELTPSPDLRKWFGHRPERFDRFGQLYLEELEDNSDAHEAREKIQTLLRDDDVLLLYAAKDKECNHAIILKSWLDCDSAYSQRSL